MSERRRLSLMSDFDLKRLYAHLTAYVEARPELVIAGTWPLPGEIDVRPILLKLRENGRRVALPETTPRGHALIFREWSESALMTLGRYGTSYPDGAVLEPTLILVPLLAFDQFSFRLGYGGGYYDRTLAKIGALAVGYAFSWQEVDRVPRDQFDIPLNVIVTECGIRTCS